MDHSFVAGVDIGGSHITVALVDMNTGEILQHTRRRRHIDSQSSAASIVTAWCAAMEESFQAHDRLPARLGIAMPGPFDYAGGISFMQQQNKYDALYGLNVGQMLAERLRMNAANIVFTNDAACFLQGEVFSGAAKGCKNAFGLTLGTGLGAARAAGGRAEDANLWCASYRDGIAEDYLSARWFVSRYLDLCGEQVKGVEELAALASGTPAARQVFHEFGHHLGAFLRPYVLSENTEAVVLGGNIAQSFSLFAAPLNESLGESSARVSVRQALLGENAALIGAAYFAAQTESVRP